MGASPYWYFVPYQADMQQALDELREREFRAGRYNPVMPFPDFPVDPNTPGPGAQHDTIDEAMEDADADGTRSILDIHSIANQPDFCVAAPLSEQLLESVFGTTQPTRQMIEQSMDFIGDIDRGHCIYVVLYKNGKADELFFAGYSFD